VWRSTSHALERHRQGSLGRYCIRFLGGEIELDFPGPPIGTPTAPAVVGPLVVLSLKPRRALGLDAIKAQLYDLDPALVTDQQIQTPISRLRRDGLPITKGQYYLDVAPSDVDVVDFDVRAKEFIEACIYPDRAGDIDLADLVDEGHQLHRLWQEDPAVAVGSQPRLSALFEPHRRRNRRFGEVFVRLLLRTGDRDGASHVLNDYMDRYGTDESFQDLEISVRSRPSLLTPDDHPGSGATHPGPVGRVAALDELRERVAATEGRDLTELAISAHNLDRIYTVDHIAIDHEHRVSGVPVEAAGGAGANTAFALGRLGHPVAVAGLIADDRYGALLRDSLDLEGVDREHLLSVPSTNKAHTGHDLIFSDPQGRRQDFVTPGVNEHYAETLRNDQRAWAQLCEAVEATRLLHLSSFTGDAERRLQEDIVRDVSDETVVSLDPGTFYTLLGDRLTPLIDRCDVMYAYELRLRQLIEHSSAKLGSGPYSFRRTVEALFQWRAKRVDRPLVLAVKREREPPGGSPSASYDMITLAVGRGTVEEMVSSRNRAPGDPFVADITGQGDAVAAGVHLGLLSGARLDECADVAFMIANEANAEIGSRAGLPRRSTVADAWVKYFPGAGLPAWVLKDKSVRLP